jgi:hypothetical protein
MSDELNPPLNNDYQIKSSRRYAIQNDSMVKDEFPICGKNQLQPKSTDARYSQTPPYYQLGFQNIRNCPFYNYTMPVDYFPSPPMPYPNPSLYWYYPYYRDDNFYTKK